MLRQSIINRVIITLVRHKNMRLANKTARLIKHPGKDRRIVQLPVLPEQPRPTHRTKPSLGVLRRIKPSHMLRTNYLQLLVGHIRGSQKAPRLPPALRTMAIDNAAQFTAYSERNSAACAAAGMVLGMGRRVLFAAKHASTFRITPAVMRHSH